MALLKVRTRLAERLARLVDFRVHERVNPLDGRVLEQEYCTNDHRRRLDALEEGLNHLRGDLRWIRSELDRMMPHVAAQDARLETLRERLAIVPNADALEIAESRSLLEEIQRQHGQIRVRMAGIARYEDRLRRLEEQASVGAE
jgi:chromosome segregation ATPase